MSRTKSYINYLISAKTAQGVHSPFVFDFIQNVLNDRSEYYAYRLLENCRKHYQKDTTQIEIKDFGAGSKIFNDNNRKIKDLVKHSVKQKKYGQLLFRICNYYKITNCIELGTSLGVSTNYMAKANSKCHIHSIEGDPSIYKIAKKTSKILKSKNIHHYNGLFLDELPKVLNAINQVDLAFIDGHHAKQPTLEYFEMILEKSHDKTIFIFDDINWSEKMKEAWELIKKHKKTTTTIDLFQMGIVFLRPELSKEHFTLRY